MSYFKELINNAITDINQAEDINTLNYYRTKYLGKRGYLKLKTTLLHTIPLKERPIIGSAINSAKEKIQQAIYERKILLEDKILNSILSKENIDISLPGRRIKDGNLHPITRVIDFSKDFFNRIGFITEIGLEIEDNYHNFDALNIPFYHPARTNQDTFWFDTNRLLRTQTSCVQIRTMKKKKPPIRIITAGRVYRHDSDQTHTPMFHQLEGLAVDHNISFTHLKKILHDFLNSFFERDMKINFRPSYFPFTEPSAEVEIMTKTGEWLEVLGCGMVHPNVLRNVNINSEIYSGFAFGIGIERLTMLLYNITDSRAFFENDLRFLKQFK